MTKEVPEVVEITATGGSKDERGRTLDKIADLLHEDNFFRISRGGSDTQTTDTHQHEKERDDAATD